MLYSKKLAFKQTYSHLYIIKFRVWPVYLPHCMLKLYYIVISLYSCPWTVAYPIKHYCSNIMLMKQIIFLNQTIKINCVKLKASINYDLKSNFDKGRCKLWFLLILKNMLTKFIRKCNKGRLQSLDPSFGWSPWRRRPSNSWEHNPGL